MTRDADDVKCLPEHAGAPASAQERRAFRYGLGARIMPITDGWRVDFFSVPDFEQEPGTTYPSLEEAVQTVVEWLPKVNTEEERAKAKAAEETTRLRLQGEAREDGS